MIPNWIKTLCFIYTMATFVYSIFPISGLIIESFEKASGSKLNPDTKKELNIACFILYGLILIGAIGFVVIMLIYDIPFNEWIG